VPLWDDDAEYIKEKQREVDQGFPTCQCSNCDNAASVQLINNLLLANQDNFDDILLDKYIPTTIPDLTDKYPKKCVPTQKRKFTPEEVASLNLLKSDLITAMKKLYDSVVAPGGALIASDLFDHEEAEALVFKMHTINSRDDVRLLIGGECFSGQLDTLLKMIQDFRLADEINHPSSPVKHSKINSGPCGYQLRPSALGPKESTSRTPDNPAGVKTVDSPAETTQTKKAKDAEKREQRARDRTVSAQLKAEEESRKRKRKEQVARIMAESWANHQCAEPHTNPDPMLSNL
jgi:hypothetical protein